MKGERLKALRIEKHLCQKDLAPFIGVSPSTIGMYETNRREPDDATKIKIANFFNVTVSYLMGETNEKNLEISHDDEFVSLYSDYKEMDEDDKEILINTWNAIKRRKEK